MRKLSDIDPRFQYTLFFVEADSFSRTALWARYSSPALGWVSCSAGVCAQIGKLEGRPVCVQFDWAVINEHVVCFYSATSEVVDWAMIEELISQHDAPKCDAMNFGPVAAELEDAKSTTPLRTNRRAFEATVDQLREQARA